MCRVEQKRETLQNISQGAGTLEGYQIVSWVLLDSLRKCSFGASANCTPIDHSHILLSECYLNTFQELKTQKLYGSQVIHTPNDQ